MRTLQTHHELPALARVQAAGVQQRIVLGIGGAGEPEQLNMPRHPRLRRHDLLDIELEAHPALRKLRQGSHHTHDLNFLALPLGGQGIGEAMRSKAGGPKKSRRKRRTDPHHLTQKSGSNKECKGRQQQQRRPGEWRQGRLLLQPPDASDKG